MTNLSNTLKPINKMTSIGLLPQDWKVEKLGNYIKIYSGESPSKVQFNKNGIPYYKVDDLNNFDKLMGESKLKVDFDSVKKKVPKNSLIFPKRGAAILTNKVRILTKDSYFDTNIMGVEVDEKEVDFEYLYYFITKRGLFKIADTSTIPQLNNKHIEPLLFPKPILKEQKKIASILSTWDKAIELKEKLIEQKKELKKGLMQKLLTGEIRLPGFEGKWNKEILENVATIIMGQSPPSSSYNETKNGLPLIQGNADIESRKTLPKIWTTQPTKTCQIGDIIMTVRAPVGTISRSLHEACIGRGVCAIRGNINQDFLYYQLIFKEHMWGRISQGSTFESINSNDIKGTEIKVPSEAEQVAISKVLMKADQELVLHERELIQIKQQKKGLMQLLLTGKIRVKV